MSAEKLTLNQVNQAGFTLVELSIVLVIIGLIVSSVLVGQDLIRGAELRGVITQYEGFNTAVGTFRGKYGGLPGDVAGSTEFGFTGDGDGDGILDDSAGGKALHDQELVFFWNHLGAGSAGMISGSYAGAAVDATNINAEAPTTKIGNNWGVFAVGGINYYVMGAVSSNAGNDYFTGPLLSSIDARNIDEKIDDARPYRGIVLARGESVTAAAGDPNTDPSYTQNNAAAACVSGDGATLGAATANSLTYNTQFADVDCVLAMKMVF